VADPEGGNELIIDLSAGTRPLQSDEIARWMGGSCTEWGFEVALEQEACDSCEPEALEVMECDLDCMADEGMNESHCIWGNEIAPEG